MYIICNNLAAIRFKSKYVIFVFFQKQETQLQAEYMAVLVCKKINSLPRTFGNIRMLTTLIKFSFNVKFIWEFINHPCVCLFLSCFLIIIFLENNINRFDFFFIFCLFLILVAPFTVVITA